ncbi:MAG TPA: AAA family ATPase [Pirellulaceae bacterium]|nr:AAA family ATPase [Pirellulaceae bacterium]
MAKGNDSGLLELLKENGKGGDVWSALAARKPDHDPSDEGAREADTRLNEMLRRINDLATGDPNKPPQAQNSAAPAAPVQAASAAPAATAKAAAPAPDEFIPIEPATIRDAGLSDSEVESLILKYLLSRGDCTGREVADQIRLPFILLDPLLRQMKFDQLLVYRGSAPMNDYVYQLTDLGRERARRMMEHCTYFGAAPVSLADYVGCVKAQSLEKQHPSEQDLKNAFSDILVNQRMLHRLGPAINSGRGLFLYGSAGNGKTTIAERVTRAFGQFVWIPRAIGIDGEIIRLFDPVNHEEAPLPQDSGLLDQSRIDRRWVRIRRPTIVVGGELQMDNLEVTLNRSTGISEAPLQLKSNCGTLVIDDFGRQKMSIDQLLNRWIVPLEKRYDFLNLPNGKKIHVPFDQLIIFSTNLEPKDLVDEAFLRRIPYKIEIVDPTIEEFKDLFKLMCGRLGFEYDESAINHLIQHFYKKNNRPLRCCQPRDLLMQVKNYCLFRKETPKLSPEYFDLAVENYFAVM